MSENRCPLCKGRMVAGTTDLTLRRGRSVVVVEAVPALVCEECGEPTIESGVARSAFALAERESARGATLEFRIFAA
jgi:YgiT-type zinc finger domain-containing protein